jgi:hypothetical protein
LSTPPQLRHHHPVERNSVIAMDLLSTIGLVVILVAVIAGGVWAWEKWSMRSRVSAPSAHAPDLQQQILASLRRIELLLAAVLAALLARLLI